MNQKGISIIVIILIIVGVLVAAGGVWWWQSYGRLTKAERCYRNLSKLGRPGIPSMPNPATYFCKCMGGESATEKTYSGEKGLCQIEGKTYGDWDYFCKENKDDNVYADCRNYKLESQDETANWQTYRNEEYGFEFKYPTNFYVVSERLGGVESGDVRFSVALDDIKFKGENIFRRFTTASVYQKSSFEDFLSRFVDDMTGEKLNITRREKVSDNPLLYKIYIGNSGEFRGVAVNNNTYVYIVSGSGPTVDQILSTFKFIE
jgi:putative hemolysin